MNAAIISDESGENAEKQTDDDQQAKRWQGLGITLRCRCHPPRKPREGENAEAGEENWSARNTR